ncbi:MAG: HAD family hydrolase [Prevotella sp.]|nr:HAD family hydrolase [Bacteroides sp.]MCM1365633.1 HAD family hydrolase [Prevotella sp.]
MKRDIAVLFDLDGVLIDSEGTYSKIWSRIESHFPTGIKNFANVIKGTTLENILGTYFASPDVRPKVEQMLHDEEDKMIYNYCKGAKELLTQLRENNVPIALVTSSNMKKMSHLYSCLPDIKEMFDFIVVGDMVKKSKPDPEGYLLAAKKLDVNPRRCAVFEDSLQGVKAGKRAGAFVIGDIGTLTADQIGPYSDILVNNLTEIDVNKLLNELQCR